MGWQAMREMGKLEVESDLASKGKHLPECWAMKSVWDLVGTLMDLGRFSPAA